MTPGTARRPVDSSADSIRGGRSALRVAMWSAWSLFTLYVGYGVAVAVSVAATGAPRDPAWALAEVLTIVALPVQVVLLAAIHEIAPPPARLHSRVALGFVLCWAALTGAVHFVELTMARRIDLAAAPALSAVFELGRPSLLYGMELMAWHFFLGLAMLFLAPAFAGRGRARVIQIGLLLGGALCLAGLIGPIFDNAYLRFIGVAGYGVVFPIMCLLMGFEFRAASRRAAT